jgi:hypothetical protein
MNVSEKFSVDDVYQPKSYLVFQGSETNSDLLRIFAVGDVKVTVNVASQLCRLAELFMLEKQQVYTEALLLLLNYFYSKDRDKGLLKILSRRVLSEWPRCPPVFERKHIVIALSLIFDLLSSNRLRPLHFFILLGLYFLLIIDHLERLNGVVDRVRERVMQFKSVTFSHQ